MSAQIRPTSGPTLCCCLGRDPDLLTSILDNIDFKICLHRYVCIGCEGNIVFTILKAIYNLITSSTSRKELIESAHVMLYMLEFLDNNAMARNLGLVLILCCLYEVAQIGLIFDLF